MKLRDIFIVFTIISLFTVIFFGAILDPVVNSEYDFNNSILSDGKYNRTLTQLNSSSDHVHSDQWRDQLEEEDEISLITVGAKVISTMKSVISTETFNFIKDTLETLEETLHIDGAIISLIFTIIVVGLIFIFIGAVLRWRT
tara:strand:+ start:439 stop:864 length:426 start_codon:yes stop_codon:yes gene_type:complete